MLMSVHAADVLRCEEIFRAHSGGSVEAGWSDAIFLSVHEILQFVFQSAWTSKKEESRVSTAQQVKLPIAGAETQSLM